MSAINKAVAKKCFRLTKTPIYLIMNVTNQCNAKCISCFNWRKLNSPGPVFSVSQWTNALQGVNDLYSVVLTGGEPFLYDEIIELCKFLYHKKGVYNITIPTNALLPSRYADLISEISKHLTHEKKLTINISIDGLMKLHDELRGVKGSFERAVELNNLLRKIVNRYPNRIKVGLHTVISNINIAHILKLIEAIPRFFKDINFHSFELLRGNPKENYIEPPHAEEFSDLLPHLQAYMSRFTRFGNAFKILKQAAREIELDFLKTGRLRIKCLAGDVSAYIDYQGRLSLCELRPPVGNVLENGNTFLSAWNSSEAKKQRKGIKARECACTHSCFVATSIPFSNSGRLFMTKFLLHQLSSKNTLYTPANRS